MGNRITFHDSIIQLPPQGITPHGMMVNNIGPEDKDEEMTIQFSLSIPPHLQKELEDKVSNGEALTLDQLKNIYSPAGADTNKLIAWLQSQGYTEITTSPDSINVYAKAKVSQIAGSLQVNMVKVTHDGITCHAAQNAPSLPEEVAGSVHAINGLQPFRRAHKKCRVITPKPGSKLDTAADGTNTPAANPATSWNAPYLVGEILDAYNATNLSITGKNQTIAILIDTFANDTDLQTFWTSNKVNTNLSRIVKVNVRNVPLPAPSGEETLDTEWASGIAPDATIRVYATGDLQFTYLDMGLDSIMSDAATDTTLRQVSISLGLGEIYMGGPTGEVATQNAKFLRLAAMGVNVFVASGDAGSNPDVSGHSSSGPLQAEFESSDPYVIGVGGTSLKLTNTGAIASETGWTNSGGGRSIFFPIPSWQKGNGIASTETQRMVPDVSLAADPNEGAYLVLNGRVMQIGGTSWSTPMWAGFCAMINEARVNAGKPTLAFLNPLIYPLMGTSCFRSITSGCNGAYNATEGYNMVTGIGVPDIKELITALT